MESEVTLLDLPNEILLDIFKFVKTQRPHHHDQALALIKTCKHFYIIGLPILYQHSFKTQNFTELSPPAKARQSRRLSLLLRTLTANPHLGTLCRDVNIHLEETGSTSTMPRKLIYVFMKLSNS